MIEEKKGTRVINIGGMPFLDFEEHECNNVSITKKKKLTHRQIVNRQTIKDTIDVFVLFIIFMLMVVIPLIASTMVG